MPTVPAISDPAADADAKETPSSGLAKQLGTLLQALLSSRVRNVLLVLTVLVVLVVVATAYGQILLNRWNQPFYDALDKRDFGQFLEQLGVFGLLAGSLLVLNVLQRWLSEMLKLKLREGLFSDLTRNWMVPGRAYKLTNAGPVGVNPDQRMHEDARRFCELSADLSIGLLQASIVFIIFASVLWGLSSGFTMQLGGRSIAIPGYLVWAAVIYSGSASLLSYWVGRSLIGRNSERYAREADLRFSLVRVNEHIDAITLARGEGDEARRIGRDFEQVLAATRRLVTSLTNLTWVTAGYGWFTLVAPILAAAPLYFRGNFSFGGLMMAAGAFTTTQSSLRWFVDNFSTIADWRATLLRVACFRSATLATDVVPVAGNRIGLSDDGPPDRITVEDLEIVSPAGSAMVEERRVEVRAGERMLVAGEAGSGKTLLFRALAGLWPWGSGHVTRPRDSEIVYMPRTPYLPPGTLREVLAYPHRLDRFEKQAFGKALSRMGLERLEPLLDETHQWDRELSEEAQHGLALARIVLQSPRWLLIDEVLDFLDPKTLERVAQLFTTDLKQTAVIHIGNPQPHDSMYTRIVHLVRKPASGQLAAGMA
jgi:putative ATP-binding cassette transporter